MEKMPGLGQGLWGEGSGAAVPAGSEPARSSDALMRLLTARFALDFQSGSTG